MKAFGDLAMPSAKLSRSDPDLMRFAANANDYASLITDRWDLVVRAGAGLGHGAPACFIPATAEIELDTDECAKYDEPRLRKIGWNLASIDMARPKHRGVIPVTTGAMAHECGHSLYTLWPELQKERMAKEPKQVITLALALEEGRQEARIVSRCPDTKRFIHRTITALIVPNMKHVPADDPFALLHAAALLFPRVYGGHHHATISVYHLWKHMEHSGLHPLTLVEDYLKGKPPFYSADADTDDTVIRIARAWWEMLPESAKDRTPNGSAGPSCPSHADDGEEERETESGGSGRPGIPDALKDTKASAKGAEDMAADEDDKSAIAEARESEKEVGGKEAREKRLSPKSRKHGHGAGAGSSGVKGRRAPEPREIAVSKRLSAILRSAQTVSRVKSPTAIPPGRLRGRAAVEWSRDRSMGKATDVKLFRGKTRGDVIPPVRIGIAVDVSGSMGSAMGISASLGWTLAAAAWDAEALVSGVCFGGMLYPYAEVGKAFSEVKTLEAADGTEVINQACEYLDSQVDLMSGSGPRILVVISDCGFVHTTERLEAAKWTTKFVKSGGTLIYVGREAGMESYLKGFPMAPTAGAYDVPADLDTLARTIGSIISRAYARM